MTSDTSLTVPTRHVETAGIRFAYRRWGTPSGVPVVFLNYYQHADLFLQHVKLFLRA